MYRGTTPTILLELDFDASLIDTLYATFKQDGEEVFEKTLDVCDCQGNEVSFTLSQEDTLSLKANSYVYMQIRAKLNDGTVIANDPIKLKVLDVFKEGEI